MILPFHVGALQVGSWSRDPKNMDGLTFGLSVLFLNDIIRRRRLLRGFELFIEM